MELPSSSFVLIALSCGMHWTAAVIRAKADAIERMIGHVVRIGPETCR